MKIISLKGYIFPHWSSKFRDVFSLRWFTTVQSLLALDENTPQAFQNQLGYCEAFTVEFIAGLVSKEARQLLDPGSRLRQKQLRYDLFTRLNPHKRQILLTGDRNRLLTSNFNASWPVRWVEYVSNKHLWNNESFCELEPFALILRITLQ